MKASELNSTMKFENEVCPDAVWIEARQAPIRIYGLYQPKESAHYIRIPESVAAATNDGVKDLNFNPAGGRMTFSTDSPYIAIHAEEPTLYIMPHMARSGNAGFDAYIDDGKLQTYCGTFFANVRQSQPYFSSINSKTTAGNMKNYVVYFPLYEKLDRVYIGISPDAEIAQYDDAYTSDAPMVFYGSSITQGGCVCRPGNAYEGFISRRLRRDFVNLGFSGSGRAEDAIVDYMSGLCMSVFVSDYDHNAPTPEYLEATHYKMYEKIRSAHPDLPYVMISRPDFDRDPSCAAFRRDVIRRSYEKAIDSGDKNVYFIDGHTLFGDDCRDACTVDATHPNDLGHYRMGKVIGDLIEEIVGKSR